MGFAVHKSIVPVIKEFKDINPIISVLIIEAQWFNISFISVHSPTMDKPQEDKDTFYEELENTLNSIPNNRIQIILGDLNAKVGKEAMFSSIAENNSLHSNTNDNGLKLMDLAAGNGLVIKSTMFPHKSIYKGNMEVT